jgi:DNA-binding transcriptional regulator GbsR (MarR family)
MVELTANLFQRFGIPRITGQIYGLLYLSNTPMSLDDIVAALEISKGSASNGTRHLVAVGAIREVWQPGDRRFFFESEGDISSVIRRFYAKFVRPRVGSGRRSISALLSNLEEDRSQGRLTHGESIFCRERLDTLCRLQKNLDDLAPLAEKLLLKI